MTICLLRASHANEYELQNYAPLQKKLDIKVITSKNPLTATSLPTIPLWSPTDLPSFPFRRQLLNRLIGGEQWLLGLDQIVSPDDILHTAETYTPYTHQAVQLRKANKIKKLICTCWETIPHNNEKFSRLINWKKVAYRYVDLFHTPTKRAKAALVQEGVSPDRIVVIPYGVDLARFTPNPGRGFKQKSRKPIVLTVARPVPDKGTEIYTDIVAELGALADFRWITGQSYQAMPKLYSQADIFFLPSQITPTWEEQYGMSLVEAMAAGLPIVTTRSGAIPEVVGDAAFLADPQSVGDLTKHLRLLITDKVVRAQLAKQARKRSLIYSHHTSSKQLNELYN